jgi:hypothetical protein
MSFPYKHKFLFSKHYNYISVGAVLSFINEILAFDWEVGVLSV